ncbi:hypothetical protein B0H13DRAFT_2345222 [Mycena leptocephala]|nr:hypothetical protein B0H13DRAFT_2345222 [Mycena leptocephala]
MPLPPAARHVAVGCTNCLRATHDDPTLKLLRCAKCKDVTYCSKECQCEHWYVGPEALIVWTLISAPWRPAHRAYCNTADGSGIRSISLKFVSSQIGHVGLQACFILHFDLLHNPQLGIDKPFVALLDFGIEPVEMKNFIGILLDQPVPDRIKGMLQVNTFEALTPAEAEETLTPAKLGSWRAAREELNRQGLVEHQVGLVQIGNSAGGPRGALPVVIDRKAVETLANSPFTIHRWMEHTNTMIREDTSNALRLRKDMEPSDIKVIMDLVRDMENPTRKISDRVQWPT